MKRNWMPSERIEQHLRLWGVALAQQPMAVVFEK
jgi:hypothetical protein